MKCEGWLAGWLAGLASRRMFGCCLRVEISYQCPWQRARNDQGSGTSRVDVDDGKAGEQASKRFKMLLDV